MGVARPREPVTVVIADDVPVVRLGLRASLTESRVVSVLGETGDGFAAATLVAQLRPQLLITDVTLRSLNGIDLARRVRRDHPDTRVLVFSLLCTEATVLDAIEAGVGGYLAKDAPPAELVTAVRTLADGGAYYSPAVAGLLAAQVQTGLRRRARLSPREREVVHLLAEGAPLADVARRLHVSVPTVKSHRASAMRKLAVRTTAGLVRAAIADGLVAAGSPAWRESYDSV